MSYEIIFDNGGEGYLGTTRTYGALIRWTEKLPPRFTFLHALVENGETDWPDQIEDELAEAMEIDLPADNVLEMLANLREAIANNPDADHVVISDGAN